MYTGQWVAAGDPALYIVTGGIRWVNCGSTATDKNDTFHCEYMAGNKYI